MGAPPQYAAYFQAGSPEAAALLELGDKNTSDIGYAAKDSAVYQSQNTTPWSGRNSPTPAAVPYPGSRHPI